MQAIISRFCVENKIQMAFCRWDFLLSVVAMVLLCGGIFQVIYGCFKEQKKQEDEPEANNNKTESNDEVSERRQSGRPKRARKLTISL